MALRRSGATASFVAHRTSRAPRRFLTQPPAAAVCGASPACGRRLRLFITISGRKKRIYVPGGEGDISVFSQQPIPKTTISFLAKKFPPRWGARPRPVISEKGHKGFRHALFPFLGGGGECPPAARPPDHGAEIWILTPSQD